MDVALNGLQILVGMTLLCAFLITTIAISKKIIEKKKDRADDFFLRDNPAFEKYKSKEVHAFKWRGTFFNLALALSLLTIVLAFSYTKPRTTAHEMNYSVPLENILEIETPPFIPPPPPPPSPPPVIEQLLPEEKIEEDPVFVDPIVVENEAKQPVEIEKVVRKPPPAPISPPAVEDHEVDDIVDFAEQMPRFPGCESFDGSHKEKQKCAEKELMRWLSKKIKFPELASENRIEGTVVVSFVVNVKGQIEDISVLRDPGGGLGSEAVRVVELMNTEGKRWRPGRQGGKSLNVRFRMPIKFQLR